MMSLIALMLAGGDLIPTRPDTFWKFRTDKAEVTWTVGPIGDEKIKIVDGDGKRAIFTDPKSEGFSAVRDGDKIVMILKNTGDEVRVYLPEFGFFMIAWTFRTDDLADGKSITFPRAYLSCGFGIWGVKAEVKAEDVTVPAGTFRAFRIRDEEGSEIWIKPGIGIVKFGSMELSAWGVPKRPH
jgi:hypothetical protein